MGSSGRYHLKSTQQRQPMAPSHHTLVLSCLVNLVTWMSNFHHTHTHTHQAETRVYVAEKTDGPTTPHTHTTPPLFTLVCFHHAASLAPSSSSHPRSRRTMRKRASPALEHSEKTDHQTALSPVRDSRRGSVSCSFAWDPRFNRFAGTIREMVHACLLIDTLLSATPTCSQLFSFVEVRRI